MNTEEQQYLDLLKDILDNGTNKKDRTGVGTKYVFGRSMRFSLRDGSIPVLTTKKMFWKGIVEELLFFLSGETNTKILESKGVNIWKGNTSREFLDKRGLTQLPEGEMGCSYSHQWRNFGGNHPLIPETKDMKGFDQVKFVLNALRTTPEERRMLISGWCANQLEYSVLPSCHVLYVFSVDTDKNELNCHLTCRSQDCVLGTPFNIASLGLLTHLFAKVSNLKPGEISWTGVDCHLYLNHLDAARKQIVRNPYPFPKLIIDKKLDSLDDILQLSLQDLVLQNYKHHPAIKAPMAV